MPSKTPEKYSAEEWEFLCNRFEESILKTTEIAELGRNVGVSWPFKGSYETPEKYIKFSFEELQNVPGLIGKKKRVKDLMDVLREILAFDDPFSEMMDAVEEKNGENRTYERVLKNLGIPEDYPVNLMFFTPETQKLLHQNGIKTLLKAIHFGKSASKNHDLNGFINGLSLVNEATIKKHLPYRIGQKGLHLPEAIGLLIQNIDESTRIELILQSGILLPESENSGEKTIDQTALEASLKVVAMRFHELCSWFGDEQLDELKKLCNSTELIERYFLPINDAKIERTATALAIMNFGTSRGAKPGGIFGKLSNLFKR